MSLILQEIRTLFEQSKRLIYLDPPESLRLAKEATLLLTPDLDPAFRVAVFFQYIEMLMAFGRIHEGLALLHSVLIIAETENLEAERGNLLYNLGIAHYTTGDFSTAIEYWSDCLNLDNTGFSTETRVNAYISLGQLYFAFHLPEDALRHHHTALKWLKTGAPIKPELHKELYVRVLINLVADLYELKQLEEAIAHLDEAELLAQEIGHLEYQGEALSYRTLILLEQGRLDEVTQFLQRGHSMERYWAWGEICWKIASGKLLQAKNQHQQAIDVFHQALDLSESYDCRSKIHVVHAILASAYDQLGETSKAEQHHRLYQAHFNRLGSPEIFARLQQLESQLENT
ncbi:hypothetical protein [Chitinibacter sp. S2-10]|uniref:tetratricopeptide repeat protein n=1 Tax=Chitinibacter sp. S2-10 TaxID=3373597 RepID=UPI003977D580